MSSPLQVLIVDDEDLVREVTSVFLEEAGYGVHVAASGKAALERIAEGDIDVVLLDMIMPRMGGLQVYEAVEAEHPGLRFIFASGMGQPSLPDHVRDNPRCKWLNKPFALSELSGLLSKLSSS